MTVPANRTITVELRSGSQPVRTELVATKATTAPAASGLHMPSRNVLLVMAAALVVLAVLLARRQARFRNSAVLAALAPNRPAPRPVSEYAPVQLLPVSLAQLPRLVIRGPHGVVRRVPVPTDSAVTIGSSGSCDIHLDDDSLRPVHGRLTPFADGHFVLQAIGADGDMPARCSSEMLIVRPRDEVHVGSYVLVIE
ncbi:MAG: FHA domain-containing protein [Dehalococcoidia bacterium]